MEIEKRKILKAIFFQKSSYLQLYTNAFYDKYFDKKLYKRHNINVVSD